MAMEVMNAKTGNMEIFLWQLVIKQGRRKDFFKGGGRFEC